jgi:hypothetical protein
MLINTLMETKQEDRWKALLEALTPDVALSPDKLIEAGMDLSPISLRKLGISRRDLIESGSSQYPKTRAWALALHDQFPYAEGLRWTSRQAASYTGLVLFEDRLTGPTFTVKGSPTPLLQADGSAILDVLLLAQRLGVNLTP